MTRFKGNFDVKWRNAKLTKIGLFLEKGVQKLQLSKNVNTKIYFSNLIFLEINIFDRKIHTSDMFLLLLDQFKNFA
jgi:hypothetical protein